MTEWNEDHVLLDGAGGAAMFEELDDLLPLDWRWACFVPDHDWKTNPRAWDHEHCEFFLYCTRKIMQGELPFGAEGYVALDDDARTLWLCRQCGEALLRWRETDECRAYVERRARGLPAPPGDG